MLLSASGDGSGHLGDDLLELGVAIGVACAFMCLAIDLPRVAEPSLEKLGDRISGARSSRAHLNQSRCRWD